jgi:prophage regulatory protein
MHIPTANPSDNLIDFEQVQARTGRLSKATYWRLRRKFLFPEPISVSPGRKAWLASEIDAWVAARVAARGR